MPCSKQNNSPATSKAENDRKDGKRGAKQAGGKSLGNGQVSNNVDTYSTRCRLARQPDPSESRYTLACFVINCGAATTQEHGEHVMKQLMPHRQQRRVRQLKLSRLQRTNAPRRTATMRFSHSRPLIAATTQGVAWEKRNQKARFPSKR
jgi:hypothetical protein